MSIMQSGVVEVKLTRGLVTIIDAEDFELVSQHKWCSTRGGNTDYAHRESRTIWLHRVLLNAPDWMHVDHINGNGLDNRRANLRLCTSGENRRNARKHKMGSSEFKGVRKLQDGYRSPWQARIFIDKKRYAKSFPTEIEAALWYDKMAIEHFGEFAKLNFPVTDLNYSEVEPDE